MMAIPEKEYINLKEYWDFQRKKEYNKEKVIKIIEAEVLSVETSALPGSVIEQNKEACLIATGDGILSLKRVQLAGKNVVSIRDFNNAYKLIRLS